MPVAPLIAIHVGGGATWLIVSVIVALRRRAGPWLLALQIGASLATLLAGILLWHALHSGGMGPVERWLILGTFCAFIALGMQIGVIATVRTGPIAAGGLGLHWASVVFLALAAAAMVTSRLI